MLQRFAIVMHIHLHTSYKTFIQLYGSIACVLKGFHIFFGRGSIKLFLPVLLRRKWHSRYHKKCENILLYVYIYINENEECILRMLLVS